MLNTKSIKKHTETDVFSPNFEKGKTMLQENGAETLYKPYIHDKIINDNTTNENIIKLYNNKKNDEEKNNKIIETIKKEQYIERFIPLQDKSENIVKIGGNYEQNHVKNKHNFHILKVIYLWVRDKDQYS